MAKVIRIFTFFFLTILAIASSRHTTAQGSPRLNLDVAADQGLISYEAHGLGFASGATIDLTVTNLSDGALEVVIPPGMRFVPEAEGAIKSDPNTLSEIQRTVLKPFSALIDARRKAFFAHYPQNESFSAAAASQGMVAGSEFVMFFSGGAPVRPSPSAHETQSFTIEAYCINAHLENPGESTFFTVFTPPEDDITRLMSFYSDRGQPVSLIALQVATWVITDDVDMDFLIAVGYEPTPAQYDEAIYLLVDAGIDITDKQLPSRPVPINPADGITTTNPQPVLIWTPVRGAVSYEVSLDIINGTPLSNIFSGYSVGTTFTPPAPLYAATYYWAVRAITRNNAPLPWSDTRSFTLLSLPNAAPVRNLVTTHQPTLTWNRVTWASGYQIEISRTGNFTGNTIISDVLLPGELSWVTDYLGNGTWFWRVRARRLDGVTWGTWSATEPLHVFVP